MIEALCLLTHNRDIPYEHCIEQLAGNPITRAVKLADLDDNLGLRRLKQFTVRDTR